MKHADGTYSQNYASVMRNTLKETKLVAKLRYKIPVRFAGAKTWLGTAEQYSLSVTEGEINPACGVIRLF